jgi:hypothetical protein
LSNAAADGKRQRVIDASNPWACPATVVPDGALRAPIRKFELVLRSHTQARPSGFALTRAPE